MHSVVDNFYIDGNNGNLQTESQPGLSINSSAEHQASSRAAFCILLLPSQFAERRPAP
jgi:hypothetical protein